jgi:hypothetical protein
MKPFQLLPRTPKAVTPGSITTTALLAKTNAFMPTVGGVVPRKRNTASELFDRNESCPKLVTLAGIVMDVNPEPENAWDPILSTPDGITTAPVQLCPEKTHPLTME